MVNQSILSDMLQTNQHCQIAQGGFSVQSSILCASCVSACASPIRTSALSMDSCLLSFDCPSLRHYKCDLLACQGSFKRVWCVVSVRAHRSGKWVFVDSEKISDNLKCYHDIFAEKSSLKETRARMAKLNCCTCASRGVILHQSLPGCHRARVVKAWKEEENRNIRTRHTIPTYSLLTGSPEALASGCCWVFDVAMATLGVCWKTELYSWTCLAFLHHFLVDFFPFF